LRVRAQNLAALTVSLALALLGRDVGAAEITRVASSFESDRPFGLYLDVGINRRQESGTIFLEGYENNQLSLGRELQFDQVDTQLDFDVHLGIFRGLEFHFGLPIVFQQDRSLTQLAPAETTRVTRVCGDARGVPCDMPGAGTDSLYSLPSPIAGSYLSGLGDVTFGLGWAALRQDKQSAHPTLVFRLDYSAPTATRNEPAQNTSPQSRGNIGDRAHRLRFGVAVSRRMENVEPYFHTEYVAPVTSSSVYSNCNRLDLGNLGAPENCGTGVWTKAETSLRPAHTVTGALGAEFHLYERPEKSQRILLDAKGFVTFVSASRSYNAMSPLLQKLLWSDAHALGGARLSLLGQAGDFLQLKVSASLAGATERFLTNESPGVDLDGSGQVDWGLDSEQQRAERNPNFDARVDRVGRRFRLQEIAVFELSATATFRF
jgi:hypothetical protein